MECSGTASIISHILRRDDDAVTGNEENNVNRDCEQRQQRGKYYVKISAGRKEALK